MSTLAQESCLGAFPAGASPAPKGTAPNYSLAVLLAWKDYWSERLLSACSVLGLAAALTPLLVLLGVQYGIISALTDTLLQDPRTLEVSPVGSGKFGPDWFREIRANPAVAFVVPQTRSIAATITLRREPGSPQSSPADATEQAASLQSASAADTTGQNSGPQSAAGAQAVAPSAATLRQVTIPLIATADGDPLLGRFGLRVPSFPVEFNPDAAQNSAGENSSTAQSATGIDPAGSAPDTAGGDSPGASGQPFAGSAADNGEAASSDPNFLEAQTLPGIVISAASAQKLGVVSGDIVVGYLERSWSGRRESQTVSLLVEDVLPPEALDTDSALVPLAFLVALEDYRDGKVVPFFGWQGNMDQEGVGESLLPGSPLFREFPDPWQRVYASFRLYATALDQVEPLRRYFLDRNLEVYVRSAEIETVRSLDRAFTIVFALITGAAVFGFAAATASNSLAGVKRKSRSLGILRLMGFSRGGMILFPLLQALFTGVFGFLLALGLYALVAFSIDSLFTGTVPNGMPVCTLPLRYGLTVFLAVLGLSALAAAAAALQATQIEPSEVIRDI